MVDKLQSQGQTCFPVTRELPSETPQVFCLLCDRIGFTPWLLIKTQILILSVVLEALTRSPLFYLFVPFLSLVSSFCVLASNCLEEKNCWEGFEIRTLPPSWGTHWEVSNKTWALNIPLLIRLLPSLVDSGLLHWVFSFFPSTTRVPHGGEGHSPGPRHQSVEQMGLLCLTLGHLRFHLFYRNDWWREVRSALPPY